MELGAPRRFRGALNKTRAGGRLNTEQYVYAWSLAGDLLESVPPSSFAAAHDLDVRDLFTRLLLVQAVTGREPEPLVLASDTGDLLLTLTPRLWSVPLH